MRKVEFYTADICIFDDEMLYERVKAFVTPARLARAMRSVRQKDQKLSILAEMLISYAFSVHGFDPHPALLVGEHGKPYANDGRLNFNLSHSGTRAVLAVTSPDTEIGCDVETIAECNIKIAQRMFTPEDVARLQEAAAAEADVLFTDMWTKKESFLKCIGVGLSASNRNPDDHYRFFRYEGLEGYRCTICLKTDEPFSVEVREVTSEMLAFELLDQ